MTEPKCVGCGNPINPLTEGFYNYPSGIQCCACVESKKKEIAPKPKKEKAKTRKQKLARILKAQEDILIYAGRAKTASYKEIRNLAIEQIEISVEISKSLISML